MRLRPLHDWVLVERTEAEERTAGGIIIPSSAKEKPSEGIVQAVGPGRYKKEKGKKEKKFIPTVLKPGERIVFIDYKARDIDFDRGEITLIREEDVLGVYEGAAPAAKRTGAVEGLPPLPEAKKKPAARKAKAASKKAAVRKTKPKKTTAARKTARKPAVKKTTAPKKAAVKKTKPKKATAAGKTAKKRAVETAGKKMSAGKTATKKTSLKKSVPKKQVRKKTVKKRVKKTVSKAKKRTKK
jgi:chaperonin GroES